MLRWLGPGVDNISQSMARCISFAPAPLKLNSSRMNENVYTMQICARQQRGKYGSDLGDIKIRHQTNGATDSGVTREILLLDGK